MKKSELRQMIKEVLQEEFSNIKTLKESDTSKIYIVFNYYPIKYSSGYDLDNFYLHTASTDRAKVVNSLKEQALYRADYLGNLDNTLVCYSINPEKYNCTMDDFYEAEGIGGHDLHWNFRDVVYALTSLADYETPIYKLDMSDIASFYEDFIDKYGSSLGLSIDDLYKYGNYNLDTIAEIRRTADFKKFIEGALTSAINAAI